MSDYIDFNDFDQNPEDVETPTKPKSAYETSEEIFLRGVDGLYFKNKRLEPFCFMRRRAAFAMGLKLATLSQDAIRKIEQPDGEQTVDFYDGFDSDILIMLWLLSVSKSDAMRAIRLPEKAWENAIVFGEKNKIEPGTPEFAAAAEIFVQTISDWNNAQGKIVDEKGKPPKGKTKRGK